MRGLGCALQYLHYLPSDEFAVGWGDCLAYFGPNFHPRNIQGVSHLGYFGFSAPVSAAAYHHWMAYVLALGY